MSELNIKPQSTSKPFLALAGLAAAVSVAGLIVASGNRRKRNASLEGKARKALKKLEKTAKTKKKKLAPLKAQVVKTAKDFKKQAKAHKKQLSR